MVSRLVRDQEASSSNLDTPTSSAKSEPSGNLCDWGCVRICHSILRLGWPRRRVHRCRGLALSKGCRESLRGYGWPYPVLAKAGTLCLWYHKHVACYSSPARHTSDRAAGVLRRVSAAQRECRGNACHTTFARKSSVLHLLRFPDCFGSQSNAGIRRHAVTAAGVWIPAHR